MTSVHEGDSTFTLGGRTLGDALGWVTERFGRPLSLPARRPPPHAVLSGGRFPFGNSATKQLGGEFEGAAAGLARFTIDLAEASPVRCWPATFELSTLVPFGQGAVCLGFSPGDERHSEPYWYVGLGPQPGSTAATLPSPGPLGADPRGEPALLVSGFLGKAFAACREQVQHARPLSGR